MADETHEAEDTSIGYSHKSVLLHLLLQLVAPV